MLKRRLEDEWIILLDGIIGNKNRPAGKIKKRMNKKTGEKPLQGLLRDDQRIYCSYKGKDYVARVMPSGTIKMIPSGQCFDSPSMAGIAITKKKTMNGWRFWKYKDKNGELVYIDKLRKGK